MWLQKLEGEIWLHFCSTAFPQHYPGLAAASRDCNSFMAPLSTDSGTPALELAKGQVNCNSDQPLRDCTSEICKSQTFKSIHSYFPYCPTLSSSLYQTISGLLSRADPHPLGNHHLSLSKWLYSAKIPPLDCIHF